VAFFVGLVSAVLSRTVAAGRVVLGEMSLHGVWLLIKNFQDLFTNQKGLPFESAATDASLENSTC